MDQVKFIKTLKLDKWFLEEAGKQDSVVNRFLSNFILNFILKNLTGEKKKEFLGLVSDGKNEEILSFVQENIEGFEEKIQKELKKKIASIKEKVLKATSEVAEWTPPR